MKILEHASDELEATLMLEEWFRVPFAATYIPEHLSISLPIFRVAFLQAQLNLVVFLCNWRLVWSLGRKSQTYA